MGSLAGIHRSDHRPAAHHIAHRLLPTLCDEREQKRAPKRKIPRINLADSKNRCTFAADFKQIARDDGLHLGKKPAFCSRFTPSLQPLSKDCTFKVDPLAQSVEHNTFNVGVLGSSPKRITLFLFYSLSFCSASPEGSGSWGVFSGDVNSQRFAILLPKVTVRASF